jgi:hypothetical protein
MTGLACTTKGAECVPYNFVFAIGEDDTQYAVDYVSARSVEQLTPCDTCPFQIIGDVALKLKVMVDEGITAAELYDVREASKRSEVAPLIEKLVDKTLEAFDGPLR